MKSIIAVALLVAMCGVCVAEEEAETVFAPESFTLKNYDIKSKIAVDSKFSGKMTVCEQKKVDGKFKYLLASQSFWAGYSNGAEVHYQIQVLIESPIPLSALEKGELVTINGTIKGIKLIKHPKGIMLPSKSEGNIIMLLVEPGAE